jgi:hypothetical protein
MIRMIVVVLTLLITTQVQADAQAIRQGIGTQTCGQFAASYRKTPDIEGDFFTWA